MKHESRVSCSCRFSWRRLTCIAQVVGYVNGTLCDSGTLNHESMSEHFPDGTLLCIHSVVTEASHRRQGLGSRIMKDYLRHVKGLKNKEGGQRVRCIALLCKENLKGFYTGCGFDLIGESSVVHGQEQWYDMQMHLG